MRQQVEDFDFTTGDLEAYLADVAGINVIYRNKMRSVLKSEHNEMRRLKAYYEEIVSREDQENIILMTPAYRKGFVTLYNMNAKQESHIIDWL